MKHIIKVASLNNLPEIRPLIAMDDEGNLFAEGQAAVPEGFVDLGLPSGILWASKNIGATNGNTAESWYGGYYAWGELEEKAGWDGQGTKVPYDWTNYKYANGSTYDTLTKYCNDSEYGYEGYTDELTQLVPEDDVATVTNSAWRTPTKENFEELITGTTNSWVEDYNNIEGLNGRVFTSKVNGNVLFIPAAGYCDGSDILNVDSYGKLWSSNIDLVDPDGCHYLQISSSGIGLNSDGERCYGYNVRPVC